QPPSEPSEMHRICENGATGAQEGCMKVTITRINAAAVALLALGWTYESAPAAQEPETTIDNNQPFRNPAGHAATFSTQGLIDLTGEYFQAQGANGRSAPPCHIPQEAWSITPGTIQRMFDETGGTHPIFRPLDANNENADLSTVEAREAGYSMLLSRGVFRRGGAPRAERDWDLVAVDDPHGFANTGRLLHWRRGMPTINFPLGAPAGD